MAQPIVIYWPDSIGHPDEIAGLQTLSGAANLTLNSTQRNSDVSTYGPYIYDKVIRSIAIRSATATTFSITGLGIDEVDANGNPIGPLSEITEELVHPGGGAAVYSDFIWKRIDSISVPIAVANVRVGFGSKGITDYVFMDYNKIDWQASCQMFLFHRSTLIYSVYQSLTRPETPNPDGTLEPAPLFVPGFAVAAAMTAATTSQISILPFPVTVVWATVSANTTATEEAYLTVLQQGIRS